MKPNPFGLLAFLHWNHEWNHFHFPEDLLPKAVKQIQRLGVGMVRLDILWSDVEAVEGSFDFARYERIIHLIRDHGIDVLAILHYNRATQETDPKQPRWNDPPADFDHFARYVEASVKRFKPLISHWEIWNEPNLDVYWTAPKDGLTLYSKLLKKSYIAAKTVNPDAMILHGGLTEPVVEDVANLYKQTGKDFFDKINIHTFVDPQDPGRRERFSKIIAGIERVKKEHGDEGKKIWVTEMGCPGLPAENEMKWFGGGPVTEAEQALWVEEQFSYLSDHSSVEKMFWAFYRDTEGEFNDATDYLGLVRKDLSEKPAFDRLKKMISDSKNNGGL